MLGNQYKKLRIDVKDEKKETQILTIRLQKNLIDSLDKIAEKTNRSKNEIIQICLTYAIDNLDPND